MTPMSPFEATLEALERDLTVGLIATSPVFDCSVDDPATDVLDQMRSNAFSQALVRDRDSSVGVLLDVAVSKDGLVRDLMTPLRDWMLVSKSSSLRRIVSGLARDDRRFRFIVGDSSIEGIVTRSDLHKLPVRLLAFSLVTHLESLLAHQIRNSFPSDEAWLDQLGSGRIPDGAPEHVQQALKGCFGPNVAKAVRRRAKRHQKADAEPDLLDMLNFREKWYLVHCASAPGTGFVSDMAAVQLFVRNAVMHSRDYAQDDQAVDDFDRRLRVIEHWISRLSAPNGHLLTNEDVKRSLGND